MSGFVHLHCHSTWSLLDGAIPAEALPHAAAALGFEAVALTDHDSLLGAVRFARACRDAGVKPIYGAELTLSSETGSDASATSCARSGASPHPSEHVTVLARDATGYANLCRLITRAHLGNERGAPSVTFEAIAERAEGLFVLSGCERGRVARLAAAGALADAVAAARRWREALGDGYRIEVFDHRGYGHRALRDRLLHVAREACVPGVASNDVHYANPEHAGTHELLHAIKEIVPLSRAHALRGNAEYGLKDGNEMRALFDDVPEVADETLRIADACDFDVELGAYHYPHVAIPPGETATGRLARLCHEGARRRYGSVGKSVGKEVEDRLQHELGLIFRMGFATYFLLVAEIVDHVRRALGIRCACRGSAAGSLVCYVLGISDVDPVRYDLLFERFMNSRREELPDIDVDVESHRREEVLEHILRTYGSEQTAVCCMVDTFRARMAIREVGKALGVPAQEIDVVAKAFPRVRAADIPKALEHLPELKGSNLSSGQLRRLFALCYEIDGFPRHLALHPSGVILSAPDLADRVPMQRSYEGFTMLQADKDDVTELGLVKLDVLGVRMLSAISHAVGEVRRASPASDAGPSLDIDSIPRDDDATFELIRSSRTLGCFQIESPGQRELVARLQPDRFEDLVIDISLFRPGPVRSDMVTPFLDRRHGFADVAYPHQSLRPILAETHGVVVFHEQVIRVIAAVTGCSLDDADHVRRHLDNAADEIAVGGPAVTPAVAGIEGWFKAAALANDFSEEQVAAVWREVSSFAAFGFCKSHAAAFALPTYLSAWMKTHHPAEFFAGLLTHDPGMYPLRLIVADARRFGIPILPIDVNRSDAVHRVEVTQACESTGVRGVGGLGRRTSEEQRGVRLALSAVRDISEGEIESIVAARRDDRFSSLEDLWRRADLSRPVLENLVRVGALDASAGGRSRRELLWRAAVLAGGSSKRGRARTPDPREQHGGSGDRRARTPDPREQLSFDLDELVSQTLPELPALTPVEETEAELAISGIDARRHLMDLYRPLVAELGCTDAAALVRARNGSEVWVAGVKVATQTPAIRSGQRIIFVTIDDLTGPIDVTVFERVQPRTAHTVFHSWLLLFRGVVRKRGGASLTHATDRDNVGVTVVVEEAFDLAGLASDRNAGRALAEALDRQRRLQASAAVAAPAEAPGRLWHASGGSAGR
ncbi:DNA polymerase III subunit alpha [soil metagenome]